MNARDWLQRTPDGNPDIAVIGAPISRASISPSEAWSTPPAVRAALARFTTWDAAGGADIAELRIHDTGDVPGDRDDADASAAHARIEAAMREAAAHVPTVVVIGGDNSLTRPAFHGAAAARLDETWGLLTLDAHHDCRPLNEGPRNGTPVRELIEGGLAGERVAQVGILPFANAPEQAAWAADRGIHVHLRDEVTRDGIHAVVHRALEELRNAGASTVYADLDIDCVDRSAAPACPASLPGGLAPLELLSAARLLGATPEVRALDFTEVDANADINGMTVRLVAAALLAFCGGRAASG